jgi:DNA-binding SARP family transcriptional activator
MDIPESRSLASLRTALWRIRQAGIEIIETDHVRVSLRDRVDVDLDLLVVQARRILSDNQTLEDRDYDARFLRSDLLPGWDEDWVLSERERIRQVRLHALEALCRRLTHVQRYAEAVEAGQEAVAAEPLRESAHRALIEAHLAEGNRGEALRQYHNYATLMHGELRLDPSEDLHSLVLSVSVG